jgi:hypothetical protein
VVRRLCGVAVVGICPSGGSNATLVGRVGAEGVTRHLSTQLVKRPPREFANLIQSLVDIEEADYAFGSAPFVPFASGRRH